MIIELSKKDLHSSHLMGADTVALCEMQGFKPRLENDQQSRVDANIEGFKAEFAIARLFDIEPPTINVLTDGGVDLWLGDKSIDVKWTRGNSFLIFDSLEKFKADIAILVVRTGIQSAMKVHGWISQEEFSARCYRRDFGYGDRLVVDAENLWPIERLWLEHVQEKFRPRRES